MFVALLGFVYMGMTMTAMGILGVVQAPEDEPGSLPESATPPTASAPPSDSRGGTRSRHGHRSSFPMALWICVGIGLVALVQPVLKPETG